MNERPEESAQAENRVQQIDIAAHGVLDLFIILYLYYILFQQSAI